MFTANNLFERELRTRIEEEISKIIEVMLSGNVTDYAQYRYYVGAAQALQTVLETFGEVRTLVEKNM